MTQNTPIARTAAAWCLEFRNEDAPAELLTDVRQRVLDTLGVMLLGAQQPLGQSVRRGAHATGSGTGARMIGYGDRTSPALAALVNGTLAHATDFDDSHMTTLVHPSGPVVATALAVGESVAASGPEMIAAVLTGNELACRLGMVAPMAFHRRGMHPTSMVAATACALVAARLKRLSIDMAVHAMGITGSQASGILESFADGTWVKTLHPGWAAHAGIVAANLAEAGFTGPATVLEGRFGLFATHLAGDPAPHEFDRVTADLGRHWETRDNAFKPYACAHVIHPFVDLALALLSEGITPDAVERIDLPIAERYIAVVGEPRAAKLAPRTPTHARASLPYCVAAALSLGHLDNTAFSETCIARDDIRTLAGRLFPVPDPEPPPPEGFRGQLIVRLKTGETFHRVAPVNRGSRALPMTDADLQAKFATNTRDILPDDRIGDIIAACAALDRLADVRTLMDLCVQIDQTS